MKRNLIAALPAGHILLVACPAFAQGGQDKGMSEQQVAALADRLTEALLKGDVSFNEKCLCRRCTDISWHRHSVKQGSGNREFQVRGSQIGQHDLEFPSSVEPESAVLGCPEISAVFPIPRATNTQACCSIWVPAVFDRTAIPGYVLSEVEKHHAGERERELGQTRIFQARKNDAKLAA